MTENRTQEKTEQRMLNEPAWPIDTSQTLTLPARPPHVSSLIGQDSAVEIGHSSALCSVMQLLIFCISPVQRRC